MEKQMSATWNEDNNEPRTWTVVLGILVILYIILWLPLSIKWETSEDLVSGIVYDNTNSDMFTGNSHFKIRASVEMNADAGTSRTYCLPSDSQYIPLVKKAAADKNVKVVVETRKSFKIMQPWSCNNNVIVTEQK